MFIPEVGAVSPILTVAPPDPPDPLVLYETLIVPASKVLLPLNFIFNLSTVPLTEDKEPRVTHPPVLAFLNPPISV